MAFSAALNGHLAAHVDISHHRAVWPRRADTYNAKDDLTGIIARLMRIDAKLDEILLRLDEDDDDEEDEV